MSDLELDTRKDLKELGLKPMLDRHGEFYNCKDVTRFFKPFIRENLIQKQLIQELESREKKLRKENEELKKQVELKLYSRRKLESDNKKMREALEFISKDKYEANPWTVVKSSSALVAEKTLKELYGNNDGLYKN